MRSSRPPCAWHQEGVAGQGGRPRGGSPSTQHLLSAALKRPPRVMKTVFGLQQREKGKGGGGQSVGTVLLYISLLRLHSGDVSTH